MDRFDRLAGIGLKWEHFGAVLGGTRVDLGFFEVHAENVMSAGGPLPDRLMRVRERFELSVHGVGLALGGAEPPDAAHLRRLGAVLRRYQPRWFSEHLAWSGHGGRFFNDLLPLPYDGPTLQRVCRHIDQVQSTLGRTMLLENPSTYVEFAASTWSEGDFIAEVQRRTGCGLLLDVNNVYVGMRNHGYDARRFLDGIPVDAVRQFHLAGHADLGTHVIDTHDAPVCEAVWSLYEHAVRRFPGVPTLLERDGDIPPLGDLVGELDRARRIATGARREAA